MNPNNTIPKVIVHPFKNDISVQKPETKRYLPFDSNYTSSTIDHQTKNVINSYPLSTANSIVDESQLKSAAKNSSGTNHATDNYAHHLENRLFDTSRLNQPFEIRDNRDFVGSSFDAGNLEKHCDSNMSDDFNKSSEINTLRGQLQVQLKVNSDLKKLLVASIGDDLHHKVDALVRTKIQLSDEIEDYTNKLFEDYETLDKVSIQADLWHTKYQASKLLVDRLNNEIIDQSKWRTNAESALVDSLNERQFLADILFQTYSQLQLLQLHANIPTKITLHFQTLIHMARANYNIIRDYVSKLLGSSQQPDGACSHQLTNDANKQFNSCQQLNSCASQSGAGYRQTGKDASLINDHSRLPDISLSQQLVNNQTHQLTDSRSPQINSLDPQLVNSSTYQTTGNSFQLHNSLNQQLNNCSTHQLIGNSSQQHKNLNQQLVNSSAYQLIDNNPQQHNSLNEQLNRNSYVQPSNLQQYNHRLDLNQHFKNDGAASSDNSCTAPFSSNYNENINGGATLINNQNNLQLSVGLTSSELLTHELLKPEMLVKVNLPSVIQPKIFPRFHVETKYFGVTYDCCKKCKGEIFAI